LHLSRSGSSSGAHDHNDRRFSGYNSLIPVVRIKINGLSGDRIKRSLVPTIVATIAALVASRRSQSIAIASGRSMLPVTASKLLLFVVVIPTMESTLLDITIKVMCVTMITIDRVA
jgi:hypothetical protein